MGEAQSLQAVSPEQQGILVKIAADRRLVETATIEALSEEMHGRAGFSIPFADPLLLAKANDFLVCPTLEKLRCWAVYGGQIIHYPLLAPRRQRGDIVYHEIAHALLYRYGIEHSHGDVYDLALALMAPHPWVTTHLRRLGTQETQGLLFQSNSHAPEMLLRLRIQRVCTQIESARLRSMRIPTL